MSRPPEWDDFTWTLWKRTAIGLGLCAIIAIVIIITMIGLILNG